MSLSYILCTNSIVIYLGVSMELLTVGAEAISDSVPPTGLPSPIMIWEFVPSLNVSCYAVFVWYQLERCSLLKGNGGSEGEERWEIGLEEVEGGDAVVDMCCRREEWKKKPPMSPFSKNSINIYWLILGSPENGGKVLHWLLIRKRATETSETRMREKEWKHPKRRRQDHVNITLWLPHQREHQ